MAKIRTHYDNLKVARNAPASVIKAAYKALCQTYHPDKFEGRKEEAERVMKIVNASYEALIDPVRRASHDVWIDEQETKSTQQSEKAQFGATDEPTEQQYYKRQDALPIHENISQPQIVDRWVDNPMVKPPKIIGVDVIGGWIVALLITAVIKLIG